MRRLAAALLSAAVLLLPPLPAAAEKPRLPVQNLDEKTLIALGTYGPLIMVEEAPKGLPWVTAGVLIDAPPAAVWDVMTDFARYREFVPQTEMSNVVKKEGDKVDVDLGIRVKLNALLGVSIEYSLRYTLFPPHRIAWIRTAGELEYTEGEWNLVPVDGGSRTVAFYSFVSDIKSTSAVVGYLINQQPSMEVAIQTSTAILVARSMKERVEKRVREAAASEKPAPGAPSETPAAD